ncbi:MAG: ribosome-associated translation inhibitor RaiA [Bacteriovoracaceae bacterium]|jgi:ribosome-associated translation inhibitor RaiA
MNLQIVHLTKEKNEYFDQTAQTRFESHITKHFHLNEEKVNAILDIKNLNKETNLTLHFHYGKKHSHFHARDKNSFLAFKRILKELEREISKYSERNKLRLKSRTVLLENLAS